MSKYGQKNFMGCTAFIGTGVGALILFSVILLWNIDRKEKEINKNINIEIESPSNVNLGEEFTIDINIVNKSTKEYELIEMDIPPEYFNGIDIFNAKPKFYDKFIGAATGNKNYKFNTIVLPNQSTTIKLFAIAKNSGDYRSLIDVCFNSTLTCTGSPIRTKVYENQK